MPPPDRVAQHRADWGARRRRVQPGEYVGAGPAQSAYRFAHIDVRGVGIRVVNSRAARPLRRDCPARTSPRREPRLMPAPAHAPKEGGNLPLQGLPISRPTEHCPSSQYRPEKRFRRRCRGNRQKPTQREMRPPARSPALFREEDAGAPSRRPPSIKSILRKMRVADAPNSPLATAPLSTGAGACQGNSYLDGVQTVRASREPNKPR